jgi:hypothetical protein
MENLDNYKRALEITEGLNAFETCRELKKLGIDTWEFSLFVRALRDMEKESQTIIVDLKQKILSLVNNMECEDYMKIAYYLHFEKIFDESNQV